MVDHRDAIRQPVRLVEVLRGQEQRRPVLHQLGDEIPQVEARARVEAGRRLVHQQHAGPADEARPEVEAPPHAARVRAHQPLRGVGQAQADEGLLGAQLRVLAAQPVQLADHLEVLASRERLVDRGVLSGEAEQPARVLRVLDDVDPVDAGVPGVGDSSVARTRTIVVLPAPFGPSSPSTVPAGTSRSTPASATVSP